MIITKMSIYALIAKEIEREQTYVAMCKSFPSTYISKFDVRSILIACKEVEDTMVDILIPNWNDKFVENKLRRIISKYDSSIIVNRLLSNLRERLAKYLKNIDNIYIPAVKPKVTFDVGKKIYKLSIIYSFMTIEQIVSQSIYTHIQKLIGHNSNLTLIIYWISLRYSIHYPDLGDKEIAIRSMNPNYIDIKIVLDKLISKRPKSVKSIKFMHKNNSSVI